MKKLLFISLALVFAFAVFTPQVMAKGNGPAGKSNVGHLYLYEKIVSQETWADGNCIGELMPWLISEGGAWGKMTYNLSGPTFDFVFNGHGLPAGIDYTLIYYPDPWSVAQTGGIICLGSGATNNGGNINLAGSVDPGDDLPIVGDLGDCNYGGGAKIWLVLTSDLAGPCGPFTNWDPTAYLFEGDVIYFNYIP